MTKSKRSPLQIIAMTILFSSIVYYIYTIWYLEPFSSNINFGLMDQNPIKYWYNAKTTGPYGPATGPAGGPGGPVSSSQGSQYSPELLSSQPLLYNTQMYPKMPWYPSVGQACQDNSECSAAEVCTNGLCVPNNKSNRTVMNVQI
jgi:hypothetical protein